MNNATTNANGLEARFDGFADTLVARRRLSVDAKSHALPLNRLRAPRYGPIGDDVIPVAVGLTWLERGFAGQKSGQIV